MGVLQTDRQSAGARPSWRSHRWLPAAIAVGGLLATVALWRTFAALDRRVATTQFELDSEERAIAIEGELRDALDELDVLASLFAVYPKASREDFREFASRAFARRSSIQAVGWNPVVTRDERAAFEAGQQAKGIVDFQITERESQGRMVRAPDRPEHVVVCYLEPYEGNEAALGFDVASEPRRRAALTRARRIGRLVLTARVRLVQQDESQHGFLAFYPLYEPAVSATTDEQRWNAIDSFVVGVFRVDEIVQRALADLGSLAIGIELFDDSAPPGERRLFPFGEPDRASEAGTDLRRTHAFSCGDRDWRLVLGARPEYVTRHRSDAPLIVLLAGLLITVSMASYVAALQRRTSRIERLVRERDRTEGILRNVQKLESLGVLAGGIAHDFNNLLVGVLGNADLALTRIAQGEVPEGELERIKQAGTRAAELAHQMLVYSGRCRAEIKPVDLCVMLEETMSLLAVSISKKAELNIDSTPHGQAVVDADASQLRQVFMNLITNASDALGDAEGTIAVRISRVSATRSDLDAMWVGHECEPGEFVAVEVADSGGGMNEDSLARIFDPFFTTKFQGRGLGLAAVLGIVRGHGGAIGVESRVGVGTRFRLLLPPSKQVRPADASRPLDRNHTDPGGLVLVVDDEEVVRDVASSMLRSVGFDVVTAVDGQQAVEVFRARSDEIVMVILDLTMPRMNGRETLRELRRIDANVPVVLTSGFSAESAHEMTGAAGFVQKPFDTDDLLTVVLANVPGVRALAHDGDDSSGDVARRPPRS